VARQWQTNNQGRQPLTAEIPNGESNCGPSYGDGLLHKVDTWRDENVKGLLHWLGRRLDITESLNVVLNMREERGEQGE
jgi:hypothetical protein